MNSCYFYDPWGLQEGTSENQEGADNFYRFAGYMIDLEAGQYYCNARQYDYYIGRFTSRDPVRGRFKEPLTLHPYLYCGSDPLNHVDLTGEFFPGFGLMGLVAGVTIGEAARRGDWHWSIMVAGYALGVSGVMHELVFFPQNIDKFKTSKIYKKWKEWTSKIWGGIKKSGVDGVSEDGTDEQFQ